MAEGKLTEKIIELIDEKIREIEDYAIDTQEPEERYIHEINCLVVSKFLLGGRDKNCVVIDWFSTISDFVFKKTKKSIDKHQEISQAIDLTIKKS